MGFEVKQVEKKRTRTQAMKQAQALLQEQAHISKNIKPCPSVEETASAKPHSQRAAGNRVPPRHRFPEGVGRPPEVRDTVTGSRERGYRERLCTAARSGPRPHRSWAGSGAGPGPAGAAGPRRPDRPHHCRPRSAPSPQRTGSRRGAAHLVAEQLPHVHGTDRAPPPGNCRQRPGRRDTVP